MKDFFLDKFEYDYFAMRNWIKFIEEQEEQISDFCITSVSHIVNVHHIWNRRLNEVLPESNTWDILPVDYLNKLAYANYMETINYLENHELNEKINYHSSEGVKISKLDTDILYHILNHSNYHRAQIVMDLKQKGLKHPNFNFISFR
jgi:uncharacterized damage-inducible protein DinB